MTASWACPSKRRIHEYRFFLLGGAGARTHGVSSAPPHCTWHSRQPGTGKTDGGIAMAGILHRLGYSRKATGLGHAMISGGPVHRPQAPRTKEILKRAMGGVLFIDEA